VHFSSPKPGPLWGIALHCTAPALRLDASGERTRTGRTTWDRSVVRDMLLNPAYKGEAAFGKTRQGPPQPRLRVHRQQPLQPRRPKSTQAVPADAWLSIPVPALVSADLFAAVQEQLVENRQRARQGQRGARFLLQGLVCCARCRYAYYGKGVRTKTHTPQPRPYTYYRCIGTDAYRFGGQRLCDNLQVRTDQLDAAVWDQVRTLLLHPDRLAVEYQRRLAQPPDDAQAQDLASLQTQARKLRAGIGRLIDAYTEGLIDKVDFEPRLGRLKDRLTKLDEQTRTLRDEAARQRELLLLIGQLDAFASRPTSYTRRTK
jgi:site-specific DNA recombinase